MAPALSQFKFVNTYTNEIPSKIGKNYCEMRRRNKACLTKELDKLEWPRSNTP